MGVADRGPKILLGALILIVLIGPMLGGTLMGPGMMGPGMMWGYGNQGTAGTAGGWGWGLSMAYGMLMMLAFWAALIVGAILLVRWATVRPSGVGGTTSLEEPRDILRRRYAAGDIDRATYQQMKDELDGGPKDQPREAVGLDGTRR